MAAVSIAGCAVTEKQALAGDTGYSVPLYYKGKSKPYRKYEVIQEISATVSKMYAWSPAPSHASVEALLRTRARALEADAVMDVEIGKAHVGLSLGDRTGDGKAIRYVSGR